MKNLHLYQSYAHLHLITLLQNIQYLTKIMKYFHFSFLNFDCTLIYSTVLNVHFYKLHKPKAHIWLTNTYEIKMNIMVPLGIKHKECKRTVKVITNLK